ncbi:MAG: DNA polymerase Y family protein [Planctomycetota bacterium]
MVAGTRIACLMVPLFPLAARLRHEPALQSEPLVILDGKGASACVVAATRAARQAGIRPGLSLPQARALLPRLVARPRDVDGERAAQQALLEIAEALTPRVEEGGEGVAYGDVTGMEVHHRGANPELELAHAAAILASRVGLPLRVGMGSSKLVARVAAPLGGGPTIIPVGSESGFLAPLPLRCLPMPERMAETLARWGLSTLGDLAALPVAQVMSRLGKIGSELHAAARGQDERPLFMRPPRATFLEAASFEWAPSSLESLLALLLPMIECLMQRLDALALACQRIEVDLELDPDGHESRAIDLPAPTRDARTLLQLIKLDLESRSPAGGGSAAGIAGVVLTAHAARPRILQHLLFGPPALVPEKLATAVARLAARLGADRVGRPKLAAGHRPERCDLERFDPPAPSTARWLSRLTRVLAVRVLRPPVPIEVILNEDRPCEVRAPDRELEPRSRRLQIAGVVRVASGPWRCEEGWWLAEAMVRDYFDIELHTGLYRIYRDGASGPTHGKWFVDGVYD